MQGARGYELESYKTQDIYPGSQPRSLYVSTVPCYLDSYIKKHDPELHNQLDWCKINLTYWPQQTIVDFVNDHNIDVLCFSIYVWNRLHMLTVLQDIRSKINHEVLIIVGGPSVNAHNQDWAQEYPDADYAVFSDGETAFYNILCHHFRSQSLNVLSTVNTMWRRNGKLQKTQARYTKIRDWSPYLESQHILRRTVSDDEYADCEFEISYETSRGCPHSCSFCDWTSGLGPVSVKRMVDHRAEIELIASLGVKQIHLSDANFGQWDIDIEIAEVMAEIFGPLDIKVQGNVAKTKKDNVFRILEIWLQAGLHPAAKFAVQDIDPGVLKNISRPDIPWEEHKIYIRDLQKKFPDKIYVLEGLKGLPGQTRETWRHLLNECYDLRLKPEMYNWILIPNSPAMYDADYRSRFKVQSRSSKQMHGHEIIMSTYSFTAMDFAYFNFTQIMYRMLDWLGVTKQEFNEFLLNIPAAWERRYFTKILVQIYGCGAISVAEVNRLLLEIFQDHELSQKYNHRYLEFVSDHSCVHRGYYGGAIV